MKKKKRKRRTENRPHKVSAESNEIKPSVKGTIVALIACLPLFILGLTLIYIGSNIDKRPCTAVTQGVVTDTAKSSASHGVKYYRNTYTYEADGREFTGEFTVSDLDHFRYKDVTVYYDPDDPENSYVKEDADTETTADTLFVIFGIGWVGVYLVLTCFILSVDREARAGQKK